MDTGLCRFPFKIVSREESGDPRLLHAKMK